MNPATKKYKEMRIIWYQSSANAGWGGWAAILSKLQGKMVLT